MVTTNEAPFYPSLASGLIYRSDKEGNHYLGSCASIFDRTFAITAAHCLPNEYSDLNVFYKLGGSRKVIAHEIHPKADLALMKLEPLQEDPGASQVFAGVYPQLIDAGEFISHGFPAEGTNGEEFVARASRGHFQRYFMYKDPSNREYFAGELSVPAWGGMSGSAVSYCDDQRRIVAVITGNYESYMVTYQSETIREGNTVRSWDSRKVINYGLCAMLSGVQDWLTEAKLILSKDTV